MAKNQENGRHLALGLAAPGGALARATLLRRVPRPSETLDGLRDHVAASGARFDGRLRITAVDRASGRRAVFGSPRAPAATASPHPTPRPWASAR